ncbi:MAG: hypothetical protein HC800_07635 [Phormidesmis sp. RL_2_1]|nr:hypothetical protein [Phormidesmis sp. RL_2_1]
MLSFYLSPQIQAVIPIQGLIKVMTLETSSLTSIPDVLQVVMGLYSYGGDIVWIVDLPYLLNLTPLYLTNTRQLCSIFILREDHQTIGFAVPEIGQILTLKESQLHRDYTNPSSRQFSWCIDGIYTTATATMARIQRKKIFELLKIREMAF